MQKILFDNICEIFISIFKDIYSYYSFPKTIVHAVLLYANLKGKCGKCR